MRHWHRLPMEVVDAASLETFQVRLEGALSTSSICRCPCSLQESDLKGPFQLKQFYYFKNLSRSCISWHEAQMPHASTQCGATMPLTSSDPVLKQQPPPGISMSPSQSCSNEPIGLLQHAAERELEGLISTCTSASPSR